MHMQSVDAGVNVYFDNSESQHYTWQPGKPNRFSRAEAIQRGPARTSDHKQERPRAAGGWRAFSHRSSPTVAGPYDSAWPDLARHGLVLARRRIRR